MDSPWKRTWRNRGRFTVYRIKILEVFQGDVNVGDILEVKQLGGQSENLIVISHDMIPFTIGDDLVMFLYSFNGPAMPASFLNPEQSVYRFTQANKDAVMYGFNDSLESLNPNNDLTLTLYDLQQITKNSK